MNQTDRSSVATRVEPSTRGTKKPTWLVLRPSTIATLQVALVLAGMYGQVHLILDKGRVRQIRTLYAANGDRRRAPRQAVD
jgi:hypothetical protein